MIIIDMNQIMISNLMTQLKHDFLNEKLVRHMVLSSLRMYEKHYSSDYGKIVLVYNKKHFGKKVSSQF